MTVHTCTPRPELTLPEYCTLLQPDNIPAEFSDIRAGAALILSSRMRRCTPAGGRETVQTEVTLKIIHSPYTITYSEKVSAAPTLDLAQDVARNWTITRQCFGSARGDLALEHSRLRTNSGWELEHAVYAYAPEQIPVDRRRKLLTHSCDLLPQGQEGHPPIRVYVTPGTATSRLMAEAVPALLRQYLCVDPRDEQRFYDHLASLGSKLPAIINGPVSMQYNGLLKKYTVAAGR
jgi:hypothetical protein